VTKFQPVAQILGLLDGNGGRPPLAPRGSAAATAPQAPGLEEISAEVSGDESSIVMADERKVSLAPDDDILEDDLAQQYVM
jgi:hypothetical protein